MGKITIPLKIFKSFPKYKQRKDKWDHNAYADICPPKHTFYVEVIKNKSYPLIIWHASIVHWWA